MEELYRMIEGYEKYEISNFGNVRNKKTGKVLSPSVNGKGYYNVDFYNNGTRKNHKVHRLVAEAFIPNHDNKACVDHIDNNKLNNHVENLRWATISENGMNRKMSKNNSSSVKGIYFHRRSKKWEVQITINKVRIYLGRYHTLEEAKAVRQAKAFEMFGEYLNDVEK